MIVVRWADLRGTGFSRHDPQSAPPAYWAAAERLLRSDLSQPPEAVRSTVAHPIWTLRHLDVDGRGHWCFAVQGRRGPFGVAGGCRFGFVPDTVPPAEAWELGREQVAEQDPATVVQAPPALVESVLAGICLWRPRLPVGNDPAAAAAVIGAALRVVPHRIARRWSWSTCLLFRPEPADRWVVAGLWPADFEQRDQVLAARTAELFRTPAPGLADLRAEPDGEQLVRNLPSLIRYARPRNGLDPALLHTAEDMREVLEHVARHELPLTVHDLPAALSWPHGPKKLRANLALLRDWVELDRYAARAALATQHDPIIVGALFDALLDRQATDADNVLGFPTASEPADPGWATLLAELIRKKHNQARDRAQLIQKLTAPGGPLADVDDLRSLNTWLRDELKLSAKTYPRLYPARPDTIVAMISAERRLTPEAIAELRRYDDPLQVMLDGAAQLLALSAGDAAHLIDALTPPRAAPAGTSCDQLAALTAVFVAAAGQEPEHSPVAEWLAELLQELTNLNRADVLRPAMYGGLAALRAHGLTTLLDHPALLRMTRQIRCDTDAPAEIVEMLIQAQEAQHLATRPQQRVGPAHAPRLRQVSVEPDLPEDDFPEVEAAVYRSERSLMSHPPPEHFLRSRRFASGVAVTLLLAGTIAVVVSLIGGPSAHQSAPPPTPSPSAAETEPADAVTVRVLDRPLNPAEPRDRLYLLNQLAADRAHGQVVVAVVLTGHAGPGAPPGEGEHLAGQIAGKLGKALPENPLLRVRSAPAALGRPPGRVTATVVLLNPSGG